MRQLLVAANWKMNGAPGEAEALLAPLMEAAGEGLAAVACPPYPLLAEAREVLARHGGGAQVGCELGAQNCHAEAAGAFTGEVSPVLLRSLGCRWVILGHSERRRDFAETTELVAAKARAAREAGLAPILCFGETSEEREALGAQGGR